MQKISFIYISLQSPAYAAFADTLVGERLPYIRVRNLEMHHSYYLHAEAWIQPEPQNGTWVSISIPHHHVGWIIHDPDKAGKMDFDKTPPQE